MTKRVFKSKVVLLLLLILLGVPLVWLYFNPLPEKRDVDYSKLLYERNSEWTSFPPKNPINLLSLDTDGILIADGFVEARIDSNIVEQVKDKIRETQILDKKCTDGSLIDAHFSITIQLDGKKVEFDGFGSCKKESDEIFAIFYNEIKRYR